MDVVIIAQYLRNIENFEGNNSRFVYLAKMLVNRGHQVEIITSDFYHGTKNHFKSVGKLAGIKINALHESGYPTNVCLERFLSHHELARNVAKYLKERKKPDVIYVAIPSLDIAKAAADYCKKDHVRFIIDIQDLWPEAFKLKFNAPIVSDIVFAPLNMEADAVYRAADQIVAVSKTYAKRGMRVNKKCKKPIVVYLGTEKDTFDEYAKTAGADTAVVSLGQRFLDDSDFLKLVYIGSLEASYDLSSVIKAIESVKDRVPVKFLVMGDGGMKSQFQQEAQNAGIDALFTGALPYPAMVECLVKCDVAVNPIHKDSAGSIINKANDYAMAGLPVINTQESTEYRALLDKYGAGINCGCENSEQIAAAIAKLYSDAELRKRMGLASRKLGEEQIDRALTYLRIVNFITEK